MRLPAFLLVLIALAHYTSDLLAKWYPDPVFASKAIFYAQGGIERMALYLLVWILAAKRVPILLLSMCCFWGISEGLEIAACRVGWGLQTAVPDVAFLGLCGQLTGLPFYWLGIVAAALIAVQLAKRISGRQHG